MAAIERDNPSPQGRAAQGLRPPGARQGHAGRADRPDLRHRARRRGSDAPRDVLGRVYEYFLGQFAGAEGKRGGEFYTPRSRRARAGRDARALQGPRLRPLLRLGRHVRAVARSSSRRTAAASATSPSTARRSNYTTWRLAKMNLAVRGIDADIRWNNDDSFHKDELRRPEGRLHPRQPALQHLRLGRRAPARGRALEVRHAARGQRQLRLAAAHPPPPGARAAPPASCWPTARCRPTSRGEGEIRKAMIEADAGRLHGRAAGPALLLDADPGLPVVPGPRQVNGKPASCATGAARCCSSTPASWARWSTAPTAS